LNSSSLNPAEGIGMTSRRTRIRLMDRLAKEGIHNQSVLEAIGDAPRHLFVDEALASRAYEDTPLPIGHQQTISQPYVVALMTQTVIEHAAKLNRILEIGTGCGYQTCILARLFNLVYSIERIESLHRQARNRLYDLKIRNTYLKHGDGFEGWLEHSLYDAILVTAAPQSIPDSLTDQLNLNGVMVLPQGNSHNQRLVILKKTKSGLTRQEADQVMFVPMLSGVK
jgi:protein-L-isoaspartate(D-aspartate) O-methyltransferase